MEYWFKHKVLNLPVLASEHGKSVDDLIVYVHALMAVLFVGWLAYFLYALVRFRQSKNPKADYVGGHYAGVDGKMGRQDPALSSSGDPFGVDRKNDPDAKDDVVVANNFGVPVNKPVVVHISSLDVIHSFAIRSMRICQDATPGLSVPAWFTPVKEGKYKVSCAQLCGNSHYTMQGTLEVVSQAEYDKWLAEQSAKARSAGTAPKNYE